MFSRGIDALKKELNQLEEVVTQIAGDWVITAAEEPAILIPYKYREEVQNRLVFCGADTGPPELPEACYYCCRQLERGTVRASRAFNIGFWAQVAIDCVVSYRAEPPYPGVEPSQWIILRGDHPLIPCRVYSEEEAIKLIRESEDPIVDSFESLAEVNLFCLGASREVPKLVSWRRL